MFEKLLKTRFLYVLFFLLFILFFNMSSSVYKHYNEFKDNGIFINADVEERDLSDFSMIIKYNIKGIDYYEKILILNSIFSSKGKIDIYVYKYDFHKFILKKSSIFIYLFFVVTFIILGFVLRFFIKAHKMSKSFKKIKQRCNYCTVYIDGFRDVFIDDNLCKVIRFIYRDNKEKMHYLESKPVNNHLVNMIIDNDIFTTKVYVNKYDLREFYFFEEDIKKY